jgi:hypothetical protein
MSVPNRASNSFILRRLEPAFLRRSGYSQSCRNLEQVPHFGLVRSHFSFRFRHEIHEIVFSIVACVLSSFPVELVTAASLELLFEGESG